MINNKFSLYSWFDKRFPISQLLKDHVTGYYAPKNFNFWYYFGSLSIFVLVIQLLSGIWLAMNYNPSSEGAFDSVEYIMRDVPYGWLLRYMHSTGASFFFVVVYLHMFRALLYGSYKKPRELLWVIGMVMLLLLMGECFFGYLLPWGNMSFWGAKVITSLFGAIPVVGESLAEWLRGDYNVSGVTLNRFFSLHVAALPLALLGLVLVHILALHKVGSNNPDGITIKNDLDKNGNPVDGIPFHPYYTVKDTFGLAVFLIFFCSVMFFDPTFFGLFLEAPNFSVADPMKTPEHIAPVWYMTPYYAILRAVPDKLLGIAAMGASLAILFLLPWLDRSPVRSMRYRGPFSKFFLALFVVSFVSLAILGALPPTPFRTILSQFFSVCYFSYFIFMPFFTKYEVCLEVPKRVT